MPDRGTLRTIEATAVLLYLLQALRVLLSSLFGVAYEAVFAETIGGGELTAVATCVVAACLAPLFVPRQREDLVLLLSSLVTASARVALTINQPRIRLWSSLLVIGAAGCYAATLLRRRPRRTAGGLGLAFVAGQFLRAVGQTYDVSLRGWWLPLQVLLSVLIGAASWQLFSTSRPEAQAPVTGGPVQLWRGLRLGALLFLETSLLGFPNVLARWTGVDYAVVTPLLMAATLLPILRSTHWGAFGLFCLALVAGWVTGHSLYQVGVLATMLVVQSVSVSSLRALAGPRGSGRPNLSFVLAMTFFMTLNVALAFAFTYPYTVSFFRDKGDYVFLLAILVLLLSVREPKASIPQLSNYSPALAWGAAAVVVLITAVFAVPARPVAPGRGADSFNVGTYNIHYGYNSNWRFSLEDQARTIERSGADIVLLQEVDAGRITSYGVDDALWLARRLGMQHVFGAALEDLSGVALLSRFPIVESEAEQLSSELEQTAIVHARVLLDARASEGGDATGAGRPLDAYGTWLGLEPEERARQLEDALSAIGDADPAVLGGDFNAEPASPTYRKLRIAGFQDPFGTSGVDAPPTSPALNPAQRIDFVWTRGLEARNAQVLDSLASDHRMVVVELALP